MNIAIAGGTFDPVHHGHLDPLISQIEHFNWLNVLFIPASIQPFKGTTAASSWDRHAMLVLATEETPTFRVLTTELERPGVSYTVDTLEALRAEYPEARLDWIIGSDNVGRLQEWRNLDRILELANFVVLRRGKGGFEVPPELAERIVDKGEMPPAGGIASAENPLIEISSTTIRQRRREGLSIEGMVPFRVERYIEHNGLYVGD
ncbi:MAG: nicotinate (nicotinamide) nucleotide adenylyltransferase [Acidobacteria bacterium]|nr:nicotinate (nicotinamide) nucleotide adenylyltransferase [Acidobacteriota bacterium]